MPSSAVGMAYREPHGTARIRQSYRINLKVGQMTANLGYTNIAIGVTWKTHSDKLHVVRIE